MRDSGRISAAIEVLTDFEARRVPLKVCLADWGRSHRFAGSKDRAWISGLCLDALRQKASLAWQMKSDSPRAVILATLAHVWGWPIDRVQETASEEPHGPGALTEEEMQALQAPASLDDAPLAVKANMPEWLTTEYMPSGFDLAQEGAAMTTRASVDLRVNTLKADVDKAKKAVSITGAEPSALLATALRIPAPAAHERASSVETIPAYNKGWVEVQDIGSQLCALAAGDVAGKQVLDFCAGGGGKTLALAAMAANKGQIFAWDADGRRLAPIFDRLRRAGVRNVQVRSPADGGTLDDLKDKMDVVFIDAPCTGSGTWRRRPDTKWRLTEKQLQTRMDDQDAVLNEAALYVKPGGVLVYVTCSFLKQENEDRLEAFVNTHPGCEYVDTLERMTATGLLQDGAVSTLENCRAANGALRFSPHKTETDCFFVSVLRRPE
jgi:16S rRNA (cytosine967-C5)-methyltransferase